MLGERALQKLLHQLDSLDHLAQVVLLGVIERALEVVGDRQEVLE